MTRSTTSANNRDSVTPTLRQLSYNGMEWDGLTRRSVVRAITAMGVTHFATPVLRAAIPTDARANVATSSIHGLDESEPEQSALTPEMFGATGDGRTNDTDAFRSAAATLMAIGGGKLELLPRTYIVGGQDQSDPTNWAFAPKDILRLDGFTGRIRINGNGATLKCADGLRFGSFNVDGSIYPAINTDLVKRASPYEGMIHAESFTGTLEVNDLTLDGNIQELDIGGPWGDTGWQIKNAGLQLLDSGPVYLRNVRSINHGTDGCTYYAEITDMDLGPDVALVVENCVFDMNGRQGFSMVGGKGGVFRFSTFSNTGRNGSVDSNPHSGFDMEPEGGRICADVGFFGCRFVQNNGAGYVSDVLETARRITFHGCTFSGDYNFSHWVRPNEHAFHRCRIIGAWVNVSEDDFGPNGRGSATRYVDCTFVGDSKEAPSGSIYGEGLGYIGGGPPSATPHFERCKFNYPQKNLRLPYMLEGVTVRDCQFKLGMAGAHPVHAQFYGSNSVSGPGTVHPIANYGRLVVNGIEHETHSLERQPGSNRSFRP